MPNELDEIVDLLIKIEKSPIAYSIIDTLKRSQTGLNLDFLQSCVIPKEAPFSSYESFLTEIIKLRESGVIEQQVGSSYLLLSYKGYEALRVRRAIDRNILSTIYNELSVKIKDENEREKIKNEVKEAYILTLEDMKDHTESILNKK